MQVARLHPTVNKRHQLPLCFGAETSFAGQEGENDFQPREDAEVLHLLKSFLDMPSSWMAFLSESNDSDGSKFS